MRLSSLYSQVKRNAGEKMAAKQSFQHITFIIFACGRQKAYTADRRTSRLFVCGSILGDFIVAIVRQSGRRIVTLHTAAIHPICKTHTHSRPVAHVLLSPVLSYSYMREMTNNKSRWCCLLSTV